MAEGPAWTLSISIDPQDWLRITWERWPWITTWIIKRPGKLGDGIITPNRAR